MSLDNVFFYAAAFGGTVLLVQFVLIFLGADDGGFGEGGDAGGLDGEGLDSDATTDSSGYWFLEMISLRTLSAAATFFGLVGGGALSLGQSPAVALTLACLAGYGAMYFVYWIFKQIFKLEVTGTQDIRRSVGLPGQVYVPIDPGKTGKVHVVLQGRTVEYQAVSDLPDRLSTGETVLVADVVTDDTVRVVRS